MNAFREAENHPLGSNVNTGRQQVLYGWRVIWPELSLKSVLLIYHMQISATNGTWIYLQIWIKLSCSNSIMLIRLHFNGEYIWIYLKKNWKAQQNFNCQGWFTEYKQYNFIQPLLTITIKHTCYLTIRNVYPVKQLFRLLRIIHHHKHIPCLIRKHKRWLHRLAVYTGSSWWNCSATLFIINIPGIVFAL